MIAIKDHTVLRGILAIPFHRKMVTMATWIAHRYSEMVITDGYRDGDPGVHGTNPCRGMDIRSTSFPDPKKVVDDINAHWIYDSARPLKSCALYHNTGRGYHIHLQVEEDTQFIDLVGSVQ